VLGEKGAAGCIELPAEVGSLQIGGAIRCGRVEAENFGSSDCAHTGDQRGCIEPAMDGIARLCMAALEIEQIVGLKTNPSSSQANARRGVVT
jgi:hypothetical protein